MNSQRFSFFSRFASQDEKQVTKNDLQEIMDKFTPENETVSSSTNSPLSNFYDEEDEVTEIDSYLAYKVKIIDDFKLADWWHEHKLHFPKIYKVAKFTHAIPSTSAPSERNFSTTGFIISETRSNLDASIVEGIVLLRTCKRKFSEIDENE